MTLLMISRLIVAFLQQKSRQSLLHFREGLRSTPQKKDCLVTCFMNKGLWPAFLDSLVIRSVQFMLDKIQHSIPQRPLL